MRVLAWLASAALFLATVGVGCQENTANQKPAEGGKAVGPGGPPTKVGKFTKEHNPRLHQGEKGGIGGINLPQPKAPPTGPKQAAPKQAAPTTPPK